MNQQSNGTPVSVQIVTDIYDGPRKEHLSFHVKGQLIRKGDAEFLRYEEDWHETGKVDTIVKMKEREVYIMRSGNVSMRQLYRKGEETVGTYDTGYGPLKIVAKTTQVDLDYKVSPIKGKLTLSYQLNVQNEPSGRFRMTVMFRENKEENS